MGSVQIEYNSEKNKMSVNARSRLVFVDEFKRMRIRHSGDFHDTALAKREEVPVRALGLFITL